jgi:hypothetical protein
MKTVCLLPIVFALATTSCDKKPRTEQLTFSPDRTGLSRDAITESDNPRSGLALDAYLRRKADQFLVGFERFHDEHLDLRYYYRSAAHFDLSPIVNIKSKVVDDATLTFEFDQSLVRGEDGTPERFPGAVSCARELLNATDWPAPTPPADEPTTFSGDVIATLPDNPPGPGTPFSIGVGKAVANWVLSPDRNIGFVLKGRQEDLAIQGNAACASLYNNPRLVVRFRVFED